MDVPPDPTPVLENLAGREFGTEGDFLAALAAATWVINAAVSSDVDESYGIRTDTDPRRAYDVRSVGVRGDGSSEPERRFREWVAKLYDIARRGAEQFDAAGFSITVGFPLGVSVTVDFQTKHQS